MRKEIVWPICLAMILVAVFYSQRQLREMAEDPAKMGELPFADETAGDGASPREPATPKGDNVAPSSPPEHPPAEEQAVPETIQTRFRAAAEAFQKKDAIAASSSAEVHHTPEVMLRAAEQLGGIVELEMRHPELKESFKEFYLSCARDEKSITVIRAQCLEKYMQRQAFSEPEAAQALTEFPEEVQRLYKAL